MWTHYMAELARDAMALHRSTDGFINNETEGWDFSHGELSTEIENDVRGARPVTNFGNSRELLRLSHSVRCGEHINRVALCRDAGTALSAT